MPADHRAVPPLDHATRMPLHRQARASRGIDEELADRLLDRAQAEGAELLGLDGLLSQVTSAVLERALRR